MITKQYFNAVVYSAIIAYSASPAFADQRDEVLGRESMCASGGYSNYTYNDQGGITEWYECTKCVSNAILYTTNINGTSAHYCSCPPNYYISGKTCNKCPSGGIFTNAAMTTPVSAKTTSNDASSADCYVPAGTYYDAAGTFTLSTACYYDDDNTGGGSSGGQDEESSS